MFKIVKNIIDEWDPIELLAMHCPPDEYDIEIKEIMNFLNKETKLEELSAKIYYIFLDYFGDDTFTKTKEECSIIADKIIQETKKYII